MSTDISQLRRDLKAVSDPIRAAHSIRYFKTGKGEYGEGDIFVGLSVPQAHQISRKYQYLSTPEIKQLLKSKVHEERQIALSILGLQFQKGDQDTRKTIYNLYLQSTKYINNWDLIDGSSPRIVGAYLLEARSDSMRSRAAGGRTGRPARVRPLQTPEILLKLGRSKSLWERRISIVATYAFICTGDPQPTLEIAKILLHDKEDLIHKAVGWMLREVGKRCSQKTLTDFLDSNLKLLPRTTLRYAIERFPEPLRRAYIEGKV